MIIRHYQEVKAEPVTDVGAEKANVRWVIAEQDGAKKILCGYLRLSRAVILRYITIPGNMKCLSGKVRAVW